jgi:Protein of unknown function DUF262
VTRQTTAPVERMSLNATNRLASELARFYADGRLTADLPYQRGSVWTEDQRIALVRSWLDGTPIPSVIINDRMSGSWATLPDGFPAGGALWAVIDGKQRIETAVAWFYGLLLVPASWFPPDHVRFTEDTDDGPYVRAPGLTETGQRLLENRAMFPAATASVATVEAEAEIYLRVNGGGTAQVPADMDRAARAAGR